MTFSEIGHSQIPVELKNGATIRVEVAETGREDVSFNLISFQGVTDAIEGLTEAISNSLKKVSPCKTSVKLGLEIGIDQGSLVATIVKGSGKANLEIVIEWE